MANHQPPTANRTHLVYESNEVVVLAHDAAHYVVLVKVPARDQRVKKGEGQRQAEECVWARGNTSTSRKKNGLSWTHHNVSALRRRIHISCQLAHTPSPHFSPCQHRLRGPHPTPMPQPSRPRPEPGTMAHTAHKCHPYIPTQTRHSTPASGPNRTAFTFLTVPCTAVWCAAAPPLELVAQAMTVHPRPSRPHPACWRRSAGSAHM